MGIGDLNGLQATPEMFDEEHFARCEKILPVRRDTDDADLWSSRWANSPLRGIGYTKSKENRHAGRRMWPHVFARFQKVYFEMGFIDFDSFIGDEFELGYAKPVRKKVRMTRLFEVLRQVLSLIPRILSLEVVVATEVEHNSVCRVVPMTDNLDDDVQEYFERGHRFPSQDIIESEEILRPFDEVDKCR